MKNLLWMAIALIFISSCAKNEEQINQSTTEKQKLTGKTSSTTTLAAGDDWVWVTNQTNNKIEIYDPNTNWSSTATGILKFSWKPVAGTGGNGYSDYAVGKWVRPNDFKVRNVSAWGGNHLCAVGGGGLATIAAYPSGQKKWAFNIPGPTTTKASNPHGCELLPNGNIVVAATDIDSVLLFASSTLRPDGKDNTHRVGIRLVKAHAVLWDPAYNTLWAIGNDHILALTIGGTAANPTLTEDATRRGYLPTLYGHDLSSDLTNSTQLLCSTNSSTHIFHKNTTGVNQFTATPAGLTKSFVKGISNQVSGSFVITRADSAKPASSKPIGSATEDWQTRYVDLHSSAGVWLESKTRLFNGVYQDFYKAKVFRTAY
jgi:hypothetical protein